MVHNLHVSESSDDELGIYSLYSLDTNRPSPSGYSVEMLINGKPCKMKVDTAADYSITQCISGKVCRHTLNSI